MVQVQSRPLPSASPSASPLPSPSANFFGRVAVVNGLITQAQLDECLRIQERLKGMGLSKRLGEILIEKRFLSEEQVHDLLELQHHRALTGNTIVATIALPESVGPRLGDLLLENNLISKPLLDDCLGLQKQLRNMGVQMKLGDILHQRGHLKPEVVACVLRLQRARKGRTGLRKAVAVIGVVCAASILVAIVAIVKAMPSEERTAAAPVRRPVPAARNKPPAPAVSTGEIRVGSEATPARPSDTTGTTAGPAESAGTVKPPTEQEIVAQRLAEELRIRRLERELFPEDHTPETEMDPGAGR